MNTMSIVKRNRMSQSDGKLNRIQFFDSCRSWWPSVSRNALLCTVIATALCSALFSAGNTTSASEPAGVLQDGEHEKIQRYKSQIVVAGLAIDSGMIEAAKEILAETDPLLRGWEFGYLHGELNRTEPHDKDQRTNEGYAEDVVFSADGKRLIFGRGSDLIIWDFMNDESVKLVGHNGSIASVAISPKGGKIATGGWDGKVFIWDANTGEKILEYSGHNPLNSRPGAHETQIVRDLCFSPNGHEIVSTAFVNSPYVTDVPPELKIWSVRNGVTRTTLKGDHQWGRSYSILCVAFSPDGGLIATGSFDNNIRIWDASSGKEIRMIKGHRENVLGIAFSPDGKRLASASTDRTLAIWDVSNGEELRRMKGHKSAVFSVQFNQSGNRIISGCYDRTVKIWHAESGLELFSLPTPDSMVRSVAISEDNRSIAAGRSGASSKPGVTVWNSKMDVDETQSMGSSNR